jgi:hypothetical protein
LRKNRNPDKDILRNFIEQGWSPEQGDFGSELDLVVSITSSLARALWIFLFQGCIPGFLNFDRICYGFLKKAFTLLIYAIGISWSIEDGFVFYPFRDFLMARSYLKREAPLTNKILDNLLTVICCGEALTPVNSPAIANLCGIWIESIWFTKGQADALQFANTVVRRILQPLLENEHGSEDAAFIVALWLPSNCSRRSRNSHSSIDNTRFDIYNIDPASNLRRFIEILSQCPDPKSKKLTREPSYMLPLAYHDDGHVPDELLQFSPTYRHRFIYSIEEKPGLRHLLHVFQRETIRDFERLISSVGSQRQTIEDKDRENDEAQDDKAQNDEGIPPPITSSMEFVEVPESAVARHNGRPRKSRTNAKHYYVVDFRFEPSFPQFGIEGDQYTINHGIRAPPLPRDVPEAKTASSDTEGKILAEIHAEIHVLA